MLFPSVTLFLFCRQVHFSSVQLLSRVQLFATPCTAAHLYPFLYSTYKWYHMIFLYLSLTYLTQSLDSSMWLQMALFCSFLCNTLDLVSNSPLDVLCLSFFFFLSCGPQMMFSNFDQREVWLVFVQEAEAIWIQRSKKSKQLEQDNLSKSSRQAGGFEQRICARRSLNLCLYSEIPSLWLRIFSK